MQIQCKLYRNVAGKICQIFPGSGQGLQTLKHVRTRGL